MHRRALLAATIGVVATTTVVVPASMVTAAPAAIAASARTTTAHTTGTVHLRAAASARARAIAVLRKGQVVTLAGARHGVWQPVVVGTRHGWVNAKYLAITSTQPPASVTVPATTKVSTSTSTNTNTGSSSLPAGTYHGPSGVTARGRAIARDVYSHFPAASVYGGARAERGSDHATGHAIDIMLPSYTSAAGHQLGADIAAYLRSNARRLGITYVIFDQHIWNIARGSEGWRLMANRGSDNANHKNHVHVSYR